ASARSPAVNADGADAACRAAATTSSAGAVLGTKALAPASRAPKSWSSPAYMVRNTMPIVVLVLRSARVASRPLQSGSRGAMVTNRARHVGRVVGADRPPVFGRGLLARGCDRLLGDAQQFGLDRGRQARCRLGEEQVYPEAAGGTHGAGIVGDRGGEPAVPVD